LESRTPLVICGSGGFGQEAAWVAERINEIRPEFTILGFCDDDSGQKGRTVYGYEVLGRPDEVNAVLQSRPAFVCAIGDNQARKLAVARMTDLGWRPVYLVDPSVIIAKGVEVGPGTYVGAGSILSANATIGSHVIINHCCSIGHDSITADFAQVAPGGRVSGGVRIGEGAMLGSNACVAPGRRIGANSVVGSNSFATHDVPDDVTVLGVPARRIMSRQRSA